MSFKSFSLNKKLLWILPLWTVFSVLPMQASAEVNGFVAFIGDFVWDFFFTPISWLLTLELNLLKIIASYNNFTHEAGVELGWIALRDLSNMFFILILLVIAFATILRFSSYGYQQLLKRTIIIAILINFSKAIVGFLIDVVQVIMLTFVAAVGPAMSGGLIAGTGIQNITKLSHDQSTQNYVTALLLGIIFGLILTVVVGVMLFMLLMRLVALWVAVVLAPLAFVANIFPATRSFYSRWLKELGSNLTTGPMLVFFLWLTITIIAGGDTYNSFMDASTDDGPTKFLGTSNMVNYFVAIALLLSGIKMAASSGAAGASMATKGMNLIQKGASKAARRYPAALGIRAGAKVADKMIDPETGKAKNKFAKVLTGIPFYGTRGRSALMNLQGVRTDQATKFAAEDTKYMREGQKEEFFRSKNAWARGFKVSKKVSQAAAKLPGVSEEKAEKIQSVAQKVVDKGARGISKAFSGFGGDTEYDYKLQEQLWKENKVDTKDKADLAYAAAERMGDKEMMTQMRLKFPHLIQNEEQAIEMTSHNDAVKALAAINEDAVFDENDEVEDGFRILIHTMLKNKNMLGNDIRAAILRLQKAGRIATSRGLEMIANEEIGTLQGEKDGKPVIDNERIREYDAEVDEDGNVVQKSIVDETRNNMTGRMEANMSEKGVVQMDGQHKLVKLFESLMETYPQQAAALFNILNDHMEEEFSVGQFSFKDNAIDFIAQNPGESGEQWEERERSTKQAWEDNNASYMQAAQIWADSNLGGKKVEEWTEEDKEKWAASSENEAAASAMYDRRRRLMGAVTAEEEEAIDANIDALENKGSLSEEEERELSALRIEKNNAATSVYKKVEYSDDMSDSEKAKAIAEAEAIYRQSVPPPVRAVVTDEEVEERAEALADKARAKHPDAPTPTAAERTAEVESKKGEARDQLEKERDEEHRSAQETYDRDLKGIAKTIKESFDRINSDKDGQRLQVVTKQLDKEYGEPAESRDNKKIVKLLAEQKTLMRLQNVKRRKAMGVNTPTSQNLFSKALLKSATDGMDFSRLQEMDIRDGKNKYLFEELARVSTQNQQRQFINEANPNQIRRFAVTLADSGMKPGKVVTDNISAAIQEEVYKILFVQKYLAQGKTKAEAQSMIDGTHPSRKGQVMTKKQLKDETT